VKRAKLTPMDLLEIRAAIEARKALRTKELAKKYGVSPSLIQSIVYKRRNGLHG
jgi:hypothetical protein